MRRIAFILVAVLMCGGTVNAQNSEFYNTKHEVGVSLGYISTSQYLNALCDFADVIGDALIAAPIAGISGGTYTGNTDFRNTVYFPTVSVEYFYHVNKWLGLGGMFCLNGTTADMYCDFQDDAGNITEQKVGKARRTNVTLMPGAKFDWYRREHVGLYSKVALGVVFMHEKKTQELENKDHKLETENDVFFNLQASLLGVEAGSEHVRGFAELGVGEQGILQVGLRCKF